MERVTETAIKDRSYLPEWWEIEKEKTEPILCRSGCQCQLKTERTPNDER
jgi:hypothetical protein